MGIGYRIGRIVTPIYFQYTLGCHTLLIRLDYYLSKKKKILMHCDNIP